MNPFWTNVVAQAAKKYKQNGINPGAVSPYRAARQYKAFLITVRSWIRDSILITLGIFSASFGLKGFLLINGFVDGGATGISLLVSLVTSIPLPVLIFLVNVPFFILGYNILGRSFAVKTAVAISGLAICLATVSFPEVTNDKLLVAVFGGFFLGAGIGLSVRGGAVIDGTEVLAIYLSRKLGATIGDIIMLINILIFSAAAYFLSVEVALYSLITYLAASKTLDFIVEGLEEYTGVTIISSHADEIREMIIQEMRRGVTVYAGKKGFGKKGTTQDVDIIYTVITRLEINKLNTEIAKIDPHAFVVMSPVKDTRGGMIKKRPLQH
jgi:uncharacterized membrane-anchored protein YitT (DUF2179 family)